MTCSGPSDSASRAAWKRCPPAPTCSSYVKRGLLKGPIYGVRDWRFHRGLFVHPGPPWAPAGLLPASRLPQTSSERPCETDQFCDGSATGNGLCRITTVLEGILISLRCARGRSAVHPAAAVLHRRRLARVPATGPCSASFGLVHIQVHGVVPLTSVRPTPRGPDVADDGLAALVHVNVLHRNFLLALSTVAIEAFDKRRKRPGEFVR